MQGPNEIELGVEVDVRGTSVDVDVTGIPVEVRRDGETVASGVTDRAGNAFLVWEPRETGEPETVTVVLPRSGQSSQVFVPPDARAEFAGVTVTGVARFTLQEEDAFAPDVSIIGIELDPPSPKVGQRVLATVQAQNAGNEAAVGQSFDLQVDGETVDTVVFNIDPRNTDTNAGQFTFQEPGRHTVSVAGESITVDVGEREEATGSPPEDEPAPTPTPTPTPSPEPSPPQLPGGTTAAAAGLGIVGLIVLFVLLR